MDKYGVPLLTILQGVVKTAATVALPELVPFIGPLFNIAEGTLGLVSAIQNRDQPNEIDLLKSLEKSIKVISREIIDQGKLGRPDEYCVNILRELEKYPENHTEIDFRALAKNLGSLHICMVGKVLQDQCDTSKSWIHCLCDVYQNESPDDDATWGFKDAFRLFTLKYMLQMRALVVLEKQSYSVNDFIKNIKEQVDMFWERFEKLWKRDLGKVKLAKEFPSSEMGKSVSYGDISYNKEDQHSYFYRFVDTDYKEISKIQVIDLTDGYKLLPDNFACKITNSPKKSKILVNEGKLFTVDCDSKELLVFDLKIKDPAGTKILCGTNFRKKTQMVCHKEFLYAVSRNGKVWKIDPKKENCEGVISEGWCDPTALAVTDGESPIYAISKGIKSQGRSNSFYMIKPAQEKRRKQGYTEIHPESPITNMAITGHGSQIYAVEESTLISAYDTKDGMSRSVLASKLHEQIGGKQTSVHLMSDGLTLYLQVNSAEGMKLYLIKPHFVTPVEKVTKKIPQSANRIRREIADAKMLQENGIILKSDPSDISKAQAVYSGPKGTVFEGGEFILQIDFPEDYPFKPLKVEFLTKMWHPNVTERGIICSESILSIQSWKPSFHLDMVLLSLLQYFTSVKDADKFLVPVVGMQIKKNPDLYERTAKYWSHIHAGAPKPDDTKEFEEKIQTLMDDGIEGKHNALSILSNCSWDIDKAKAGTSW